VIAIAVSVSVVVMGNNKDSPSPVANVEPPPYNPVNDAYLREIRTILVPLQIWAEPNAPQLLATEFMAYTDSNHVNVTSPRLQQRYALLVLYFANGGGRWPMDALLHECDWNFVACNNQSVVTKLLMGDQLDMTGQLPAEIGLLSHVGKYKSARWVIAVCDFSYLSFLLVLRTLGTPNESIGRSSTGSTL
jgi:hypothetical protein